MYNFSYAFSETPVYYLGKETIISYSSYHSIILVPGSTGIVLSPNRKNSDSLAETSGCWSDRQSALTSQQLDSNKSIIIPECTPDGKYQKTQCAQGNN